MQYPYHRHYRYCHHAQDIPIQVCAVLSLLLQCFGHRLIGVGFLQYGKNIVITQKPRGEAADKGQ
jgi:hypothetical protein